MFHEQFKRIRKAAGKTQKEVAEHLQISAQSISKWEKGEALPSLEYIPLLAGFFKCSINSFFSEFKEYDFSATESDEMLTKDFLELEEKINSALRYFKLNAEVKRIVVGARITSFIIEMYDGIGISDIEKRKDDILYTIDEENAFINTRDYKGNTFGIEIPAENFVPIPLEKALQSREFTSSEYTLPIIIGYDRSNNIIMDDITKLAHMLIGGCSGSGKSCFIRNVITSLIARNDPEDVKLLVLDPRICEFQYLTNSPHLYQPVITEGSDTFKALTDIIDTMNSRYTEFATHKARSIKEYNKITPQKMPRIVIIIDELLDIIIQHPEVEDLIMEIGMKGRGAGIHMIIASQCVWDSVFTSLIKANVPTRVSLKVDEAEESMLVLNECGAEKLYMHGDMLYLPIRHKKPIRLQVPFISEADVINIINKK